MANLSELANCSDFFIELLCSENLSTKFNILVLIDEYYRQSEYLHSNINYISTSISEKCAPIKNANNKSQSYSKIIDSQKDNMINVVHKFNSIYYVYLYIKKIASHIDTRSLVDLDNKIVKKYKEFEDIVISLYSVICSIKNFILKDDHKISKIDSPYDTKRSKNNMGYIFSSLIDPKKLISCDIKSNHNAHNPIKVYNNSNYDKKCDSSSSSYIGYYDVSNGFSDQDSDHSFYYSSNTDESDYNNTQKITKMSFNEYSPPKFMSDD